MISLFQQERDSIAFLGLLSIAYQNFDFQFKHFDGELTHQQGLNIFAAIIDNSDGELLAQRQNQIHSQNNPMLHAEQLSLKQAIDRINEKRPRNKSTTSVENYYRKLLFNDAKTGDYLTVGATLYTTLEPCPFCSSALLVNRMKRIVYVIPDKKFGSAYGKLKTDYYPNYDTRYDQFMLEGHDESKIVSFAKELLVKLHTQIDTIKREQPSVYDTLLLDSLAGLLKEAYDFFSLVRPTDLLTKDIEVARNTLTLRGFKLKLGL